jgi:hypothetical protein
MAASTPRSSRPAASPAAELPLYTRNAADFAGLDSLLAISAVGVAEESR